MTIPLFTHKDLKHSRAKNSPMIKRLLQNPEIAKILQKPEERESFYRAVKEIASSPENIKKIGYSGNLSILREALWRLKNKAGDKLESSEVAALAEKLIPFGPKYVESQKKEVSTKKEPATLRKHLSLNNNSAASNDNKEKNIPTPSSQKSFRIFRNFSCL